jgi:SAM-dependent methyltransferase
MPLPGDAKLANKQGMCAMPDHRLFSGQFPRASQYNLEWVVASASNGGANTLYLAEWLAAALDLQSGMRVLDLGCGRATSSIFLRREFGAQVWATDLWFSASENFQRIRDAGVEDGVFPLHADARSLPFASNFFDAIVCLDSYPYFGADDLYLNYLANFVKTDGRIGIAGAGLMREVEGAVPEHLRDFWTQSFWAMHSAPWWRRCWERTGIVEIEVADTMPDAWRLWLDWQRVVAPENAAEINAIENDGGRTIGWVRIVGRRRGETKLEETCWPDTLRTLAPIQYTPKPMLRSPMDGATDGKRNDAPV